MNVSQYELSAEDPIYYIIFIGQWIYLNEKVVNAMFYYTITGCTFRLELAQSLVEAAVSPTTTPLTTFSEDSSAIGELVIDDLHPVQIINLRKQKIFDLV